MKKLIYLVAALTALILACACALAAAPAVLEQGADYEWSYEPYESGGVTVVYPELELGKDAGKNAAKLSRAINKNVLEDCLMYVRQFDMPEGAQLNVEPYEINIINGVVSMFFNGWYENSQTAGTSVPAFALNYSLKTGKRLLAGDFLNIKTLAKTLTKTGKFTDGQLSTLESDGARDDNAEEIFAAQCDYVREMGYNDVYKLLKKSGATEKAVQCDAWVYIAPQYDGGDITGVRAGVIMYVPSAIGGAAYFDIPDAAVSLESK